MTQSRLLKSLKNSYVQTAILGILILGGVFAFWFGLKVAFRTEYPLLAVSTGSMVPTLNVGDLILVQGGFNPYEINAQYNNGDIIVFHNYLLGGPLLFPELQPEDLIVHRAVGKTENSSSFWFFTTKGDHNSVEDHIKVPENYVLGKVLGLIPYVGNIPLFIRTTIGKLVIIIFFAIILSLQLLLGNTGRNKAELSVNTNEIKRVISFKIIIVHIC